MVVQHNLTAMNSNRMLGITTSAQAKATEKLSSGYKINRAADDAAGLSISEKMRKQIRGLTQASANANDGISTVQTAEGALAEVQDMLQRMNELAVKAANGTNSESDRSAIQNEIDQLTTEIDRVAETTKFNETYLLKGDKSLKKDYTFNYKQFVATQTGAASFDTDSTFGFSLQVSSAVTAQSQKTMDEMNELLKSFRDTGLNVSFTKTYETGMTAATGGYSIELTGALSDKYKVVTLTAATNISGGKGVFEIHDLTGNKLLTVTVSGADGKTSISSEGDGRQTISAAMTAKTITAAEYAGAGRTAYYDKDGNKYSANDLNKLVTATSATGIHVKADSPTVYDAVGNVTTISTGAISATQDKVAALNLNLHVGADATGNNQINLSIESMSAKGLGVNFLKVDGTDDTNALGAIETIKAALQKVSDQRAQLGAVQNRLEHTIKNLDNVVENTTSAESQIRDTDMATQMVTYSNNNILAQAGQSMLAQANQSNQGALSLLG